MSSEQLVHVIDDDEGGRESLAFLLDCSGIATRTYESAVQFLAVASSISGGCIITDVRMPELSGLDLLGRLRAMGIAIPVIVITGHADVPMAIQALHGGVSDFIEKPFSDEAILMAVRTALARQRDRAEIAIERDEIARRLATLSGREREVMEGLVDGKANKVIAYDLDISARTVEVYRANVMTKLQVRTLSELVRMVMITRLA